MCFVSDSCKLLAFWKLLDCAVINNCLYVKIHFTDEGLYTHAQKAHNVESTLFQRCVPAGQTFSTLTPHKLTY